MAQRFLPKKSQRGSKGYYYFEISLALGPEAIGVTGDNSYETLYGREYLLILAESDNTLHLYREDATDGEWTEITAGLPSMAFDSALPSGARQVTFAFDQSARINLAYEIDGHIYVTRWDSGSNQYIQNVDFAGHDPAILMDATILDPRGYPNAADDGWSVQDAYYAGGDLSVAFKWLAESPSTWRTSPVSDSDVVLFYLTPDRAGVRVRVQRQLYATVNVVHDFADPVILDRAVALAARWELLLSDAAGDVLPNMLISASYVEDWLVIYEPKEPVSAGLVPAALRLSAVIYNYAAEDAADGGMTLESIALTAIIYEYTEDDPVDATVALTPIAVTTVIELAEEEDPVSATMTLEAAQLVTAIVVATDTSDVTAGMSLEGIRVQEV